MRSFVKRSWRIFAIAGYSLLALPSLIAQQSPQPSGTLFTAGVSYTSADGQNAPKYPEADLLLNLRRSDGAPVAVHPDELALFAQGQQVGSCTGIRTFDRTGYGTSTVIALDASGALHTLSPNAVNSAVFTVVHDGVKQDTTAVTSLAEDFQVDLPFHPGPRKWPAHSALFPERGHATHLYDGLLQATSLFTPALPRRRILLIIADGRDSDSQHTPLDLLARAKSLGIEIDTIAIASQPSQFTQVLQQISLATGGVYLQAPGGDELQQMIALHLSAVRATPVAQFQLSHPPASGQLAAMQLRWLTGNQSTPAFVAIPNAGSNPFHLALPSNPWILGFGACFLMGIGLFIVSFFLPKGPSHAVETPLPSSDHFPLSTAPPIASPSDSFPPTRKLIRQPNYIQSESEHQKRNFAQTFAAPPNGPFARLVIRNNALAGKIVPMNTSSFSIGALPGNDLSLPGDITISGHHALLRWENATLTVEDNHSTNGTYLNRLRLPPGRHALKPGDEIGLGQTFLIVERN